MANGTGEAPDDWDSPPLQRDPSPRYQAQTGWLWWHAVLYAAATLFIAMAAAQFALAALDGAGHVAPEWQFLTALGLSQLVSIAVIWWGAGMSHVPRENVLALQAPVQGKRAYVLGYLAMLGLFGALSAVTWAIDPKRVMDDLTVYAGLIRSEAWWLAVLVIVIGAPVMEELMFRGFLFPALAKGPFGLIGATVTTSAAWSALHAGYSVMGLIEVFAVGLYFAFLLVRTGSLRVPMFCHGAYNLTVLALLLLVDNSATAPG